MELHRVRRRLTALVALTALTSTVLQLGGTAGAVEDVTSVRLAGDDRFETAAEIAAAAFPDGSDTVLIASGRSFPDALAGAALGLPILLTERDSLPAATAAAIDDLGADDAIILGGTAAVSVAVEEAVAEHATVSRLAGDDRYETAAEIATSVGAAAVGSVEDLQTAIIATGKDFADALAGGPLATGGADVLPILLVEDSTPGATADALNELDIEQVLILGGTAAVSSAVETQLEAITGNPALRLAGTNRYATAVDIAEFALDTLEFPGDEMLLANGVVFADALAGGPLGGVLPAPLLLTPVQPLASQSEAFFEEHGDTIETITTLGGPAAVAASTAAAAETAAETEAASGPTNETITVAPSADADQAHGTTRGYTATGLGTRTVDIALVDCGNVTKASNGNTQFANTNVNAVADGTSEDAAAGNVDRASTAARISSVNGSDRQSTDPRYPSNDYANNITPVNGAVSFVVTGPPAGSTASTCVTPVVFADENTDDALNGASTNPTLPNEDFGTGGSVTFSANAGGTGPIGTDDVQSNSDATDRFTSCDILTSSPSEVVDEDSCSEYRYDSNDRFQIASLDVTMAQFELALTQDDDITGTYAAASADRSTFNLTDEAPHAPTTFEQVDDSPPTFEFNDSATASNDEYRLFRVVQSSASCPEFVGGGYAQVAQMVDDGDGPDPTPTNPDGLRQISDPSAAASTDYCYRLTGYDDGDLGPATAAIATAQTPPTFGVTGQSANADLDDADFHIFTFNEPVNQTNATYSVDDATPGPDYTVRCGINASCALSSNDTVLTVNLGPVLSSETYTYPLTVTAMTGVSDKNGAPVDPTLAGSETSIDNSGPPPA